MPSKEYLGDSVYCTYENGMLKLTTENGLDTDPSNCIYMEYFVFEALCNYMSKVQNEGEE